MIDVRSREEAIAWAKLARPPIKKSSKSARVQEMADFPADVQEAAGGFAELQGRRN